MDYISSQWSFPEEDKVPHAEAEEVAFSWCEERPGGTGEPLEAAIQKQMLKK